MFGLNLTSLAPLLSNPLPLTLQSKDDKQKRDNESIWDKLRKIPISASIAWGTNAERFVRESLARQAEQRKKEEERKKKEAVRRLSSLIAASDWEDIKNFGKGILTGDLEKFVPPLIAKLKSELKMSDAEIQAVMSDAFPLALEFKQKIIEPLLKVGKQEEQEKGKALERSFELAQKTGRRLFPIPQGYEDVARKTWPGMVQDMAIGGRTPIGGQVIQALPVPQKIKKPQYISKTIYGPGGKTKVVSIPKGKEYVPPSGWSLAPLKEEKEPKAQYKIMNKKLIKINPDGSVEVVAEKSRYERALELAKTFPAWRMAMTNEQRAELIGEALSLVGKGGLKIKHPLEGKPPGIYRVNGKIIKWDGKKEIP
jgi:hypothetical protein